jgi:hypothetical protein
MNDHFVCSICGETHAGLTTDWAYALPDEVWALSEPERAARAKYDSDLCRLDDRHFIRCVLPVPLVEQKGAFCWGAWAEVEQSTFYRYVELYEVDGSYERPHDGTLANELSVYRQTIGVPVLIQFGDPTRRPVLSTRPNDQGPLAQEQRLGIDLARHHEIVARLRG